MFEVFLQKTKPKKRGTFLHFLFLFAHMQSKSVAWLDQQWFQGLCPHGMFRLYSETSLLSETMLHSTAGQTESHFFLYPSTRFTIAPTISVICSYSPLWNNPICFSPLWHTVSLHYGGIWLVLALTCQCLYLFIFLSEVSTVVTGGLWVSLIWSPLLCIFVCIVKCILI